MSTSDPDRPADDTTPDPATGTAPSADEPATSPAEPAASATPEPAAAPAEPVAPATEQAVAREPVAAAPATTPAAAEPPAPEPVAPEPVAPDPVAPPATEPVVAEPTVTAPPVVAEPTVTAPPVVAEPVKPEPVSLDTGRHAVVRPSPVPPDDPAPAVAAPVVATPVVATGVDPAPESVDPALAAAAAASVTRGTPPEPGPYGAITPEPDVEGRLFPDPNAPSSPSAGSRILGVIVGLILAPIAVGVLLLGESQILEAQVDGWDATTSVFGIVLVTLGLLLLGCVLLLGMWTAAVPITSGIVLTAVGAVYLYAPSIAREQTLSVLTSSGWRLTVTEVTVSATSGMVLAVGFLLLLSGLVIASARKRGVHLGEFRERNRA